MNKGKRWKELNETIPARKTRMRLDSSEMSVIKKKEANSTTGVKGGVTCACLLCMNLKFTPCKTLGVFVSQCTHLAYLCCQAVISHF